METGISQKEILHNLRNLSFHGQCQLLKTLPPSSWRIHKCTIGQSSLIVWFKYFSAVTFYFVCGYKDVDYSWRSPVRIHARLIKKFSWRDLFFHLLQLTNYFKNLTIFYLFSSIILSCLIKVLVNPSWW